MVIFGASALIVAAFAVRPLMWALVAGASLVRSTRGSRLLGRQRPVSFRANCGHGPNV